MCSNTVAANQYIHDPCAHFWYEDDHISSAIDNEVTSFIAYRPSRFDASECVTFSIDYFFTLEIRGDWKTLDNGAPPSPYPRIPIRDCRPGDQGCCHLFQVLPPLISPYSKIFIQADTVESVVGEGLWLGEVLGKIIYMTTYKCNVSCHCIILVDCVIRIVWIFCIFVVSHPWFFPFLYSPSVLKWLKEHMSEFEQHIPFLICILYGIKAVF